MQMQNPGIPGAIGNWDIHAVNGHLFDDTRARLPIFDRAIASLSDGTPLVTRKTLGQGQVVLFHVTATAEWSTLPLSGLFVEMLERLAVSSALATPEAEALEGTTWTPLRVMDGYGTLSDAGTLPGVDGTAT